MHCNFLWCDVFGYVCRHRHCCCRCLFKFINAINHPGWSRFGIWWFGFKQTYIQPLCVVALPMIRCRWMIHSIWPQTLDWYSMIYGGGGAQRWRQQCSEVWSLCIFFNFFFISYQTCNRVAVLLAINIFFSCGLLLLFVRSTSMVKGRVLQACCHDKRVPHDGTAQCTNRNDPQEKFDRVTSPGIVAKRRLSKEWLSLV